MLEQIGVILAVVLPASGVILTIATKVINNRERKVIPSCQEKFKKIDDTIEQIKTGSTDRHRLVLALEATLKVSVDSLEEMKKEYKELFKTVTETAFQIKEINSNIGNICQNMKIIKGSEL